MSDDSNAAARFWKTAKAELRLQLSVDIYEMYIHPLVMIEGEEGGITLGCPNTFVREWMEQRLHRVVDRTLTSIAGREMTVRYVLAQAGQQLALEATASGEAQVLVRPGELRQAGFVMLHHDLRCLYGPMIGLLGVGLWAEFRASLQADERHPLKGYAWLGLRAVVESYTEARPAVTSGIATLRTAGLVDWRTGRELMEIWEREKAAGTLDRDNPGVSAQVLGRFLSNPAASRIYTVSDPLELPEFCCRFDKAISLDLTTGRCRFDDYAGRLTARWQNWLGRLLGANGLTRITPADWQRLGLQ